MVAHATLKTANGLALADLFPNALVTISSGNANLAGTVGEATGYVDRRFNNGFLATVKLFTKGASYPMLLTGAGSVGAVVNQIAGGRVQVGGAGPQVGTLEQAGSNDAIVMVRYSGPAGGAGGGITQSQANALVTQSITYDGTANAVDDDSPFYITATTSGGPQTITISGTKDHKFFNLGPDQLTINPAGQVVAPGEEWLFPVGGDPVQTNAIAVDDMWSAGANVAALETGGVFDPAQEDFALKFPQGFRVGIATNGMTYERRGSVWVAMVERPVVLASLAARDGLSEVLDRQWVSIRNNASAPFVFQDFLWDAATGSWILYRDISQPVTDLTAEGTVNVATASKLTFASTSKDANQLTYTITLLDQAQDGTPDEGSNDPRIVALQAVPGAVASAVTIADTASKLTNAMLSGTIESLTVNAYAVDSDDTNHGDFTGDLLMAITAVNGSQTITNNLTVI
jgi:hypothetical protein